MINPNNIANMLGVQEPQGPGHVQYPDPRTPYNPMDPQRSGKDWCIQSALAKRKFLTLTGNHSVQIQPSNDEDDQRFTIIKYDENYFYIVNKGGDYLTVENQNAGCPITADSFRGGKVEQMFTLKNVEGKENTFLIMTINGKCLEVSGGSTASGAKIVQGTFQGIQNQQWYFKEPLAAKPLKAERYCKLVSLASGKVIDCGYEKQAHIWDSDKGEVWELTKPKADVSWYLISNKKGQFLTIQNCSDENGAKVVLKKYSGEQSQCFTLLNGIKKHGSTYFNIMTHCGKCLEVKDNQQKNGEHLQQWQVRLDADYQFWKAEPVK